MECRLVRRIAVDSVRLPTPQMESGSKTPVQVHRCSFTCGKQRKVVSVNPEISDESLGRERPAGMATLAWRGKDANQPFRDRRDLETSSLNTFDTEGLTTSLAGGLIPRARQGRAASRSGSATQ